MFDHVKSIIERLQALLQTETPEVQIMVAIGLMARVAKSHDPERIQPILETVVDGLAALEAKHASLN